MFSEAPGVPPGASCVPTPSRSILTPVPISAPAVTLAAATATKVASGQPGSATVPVSVILWNATGATLYIGGSGVTNAGATQGLPVANSSFSPSFDLVAGDDLYAYSVAGGVVNVLLTRQ